MFRSLIQIYKRRFPGDTLQIRIGRVRFYFHKSGRWHLLLGLDVGIWDRSPSMRLRLLWREIHILFWSHRDDCECDRCIPF